MPEVLAVGESEAAASPIRDAMIVAGGRGTRLMPLTHDTPKPLLDFCGQPFLAGVIGRLATAGITRVFLIVGKDTTPFEVLRPLASDFGVDIVMVPEPEPLDTAGGVRAAVEQVS
ncbi:MAG: NDP-sugar pyrophosphorylase family protein, partial [Glaciecola sp.]